MATRKRRGEDLVAQTSEKASFISKLAARANDRHGPGAVTRGSDVQALAAVTGYIPVCYAVDAAMHLPGVPCGRLTVIVGAYASGKTTLALQIARNTQQLGGSCVYIDTEYAFSRERAEMIGVNVDELLIGQPETLEESIKLVIDSVEEVREARKKHKDELVSVIVDSAAGAPTQAELDAEPGDSKAAGSHARAWSLYLRKLIHDVADTGIAFIVVNQEKNKIDFMAKFGDGKTMIADEPLSYHSSVTLTTHRTDILRKGANKEAWGIMSKVFVKKNKLARPFGQAEIVISDYGVDDNASMLGVAVLAGIIKKNRGLYVYEDRRFRADHFEQLLKDFPTLQEQLDELRNGAYADGEHEEEEEAEGD